jgi:serine/threonine protein kinase
MDKEWEVPKSLIEFYKAYRNDKKTRVIKRLKTRFEIDEYYEIIDAVGQGAYGIVVAAVDNRTKANVAIKKIEKAFEHKIFTKRTLRELKICRLLKHENVGQGLHRS